MLFAHLGLYIFAFFVGLALFVGLPVIAYLYKEDPYLTKNHHNDEGLRKVFTVGLGAYLVVLVFFILGFAVYGLCNM